MSFGESVPYVLRVLRQAAGSPSNDIHLPIVCTRKCCDPEWTRLHALKANPKDLTGTSKLHLSGEETYNSSRKPCGYTTCTTPALQTPVYR